MKWNLRLAAANRGIWKASEMQRLLAERGLKISAGKMSGLWAGNPSSIKLADLDVICAVLDCGPGCGYAAWWYSLIRPAMTVLRRMVRRSARSAASLVGRV